MGGAQIQPRPDRSYTYESDDIKTMLPHRWPMLMIDRAVDVVPGVSGTGIKCVSVNEPHFNGHYPDHSIMPGVLIVEAMAQLVALIDVAERVAAREPGSSGSGSSGSGSSGSGADPGASIADSVGYLGAIKNVKFARLVRPGDQLTLHARMGTRIGHLREAQVRAMVDRHVVATGQLVVSER